MIKNFEEKIENSERIKEVVISAFKQLSEKLFDPNKCYKFKRGGEEVMTAYINPAGTISIHDFKTGCDYVLWQDGVIETVGNDQSGETTGNPTADYLDALIKEVMSLEIEEIDQPE